MWRYYCDKMLGKPKFNVEYYQEAWDFLMRVDEKTRAKIADNITKASCTLDPKLLKKLTGEVWEFRTLYNSKQYRMLAFWDKRDKEHTLVIATHGFVKKVGKVPQKEIDKTTHIMKEYFNTKK